MPKQGNSTQFLSDAERVAKGREQDAQISAAEIAHRESVTNLLTNPDFQRSADSETLLEMQSYLIKTSAAYARAAAASAPNVPQGQQGQQGTQSSAPQIPDASPAKNPGRTR